MEKNSYKTNKTINQEIRERTKTIQLSNRIRKMCLKWTGYILWSKYLNGKGKQAVEDHEKGQGIAERKCIEDVVFVQNTE